MRLSILSVGRVGSGPEAALCDGYVKRAGPLLRTLGIRGPEMLELRESRKETAAQRREDEAEALLRRMPQGGLVVALDEGGKQLSSRDFAGLVGTAAAEGTTELVFVIGGPDGLAPLLLERAARTLAFGVMTWPHRLIRAALCEQVYRAATILAGHPYHRD